jgi:hypothetical protein
MAKKIMWVWTITKTVQKQSGYLLSGCVEFDSSRGSVDVDDRAYWEINSDLSTWTSAWTTLGAAKRQAATMMDRSRVKWDESADETGDLTWVARIESGITSSDMVDRTSE